MTHPMIRQIDNQVLTALAKGETPQLPEGSDWPTFFRGFAERQGMTRSWAVAESLLSVIDDLHWRLSSWITYSDIHFPYDRAVQNLDTLFVLMGLRLDLRAYLEGRKAMQRCWNDDCDPCVRHVDWWDVWSVNEVAAALTKAIDLGDALLKNPPPPVEGVTVDVTGAVAETLPILRTFQAFFPEFCAVINEAGIIDITEKVEPLMEPPQLKIQLPTEADGMERSFTLPVSSITAVGESARQFFRAPEGEQNMRRSASDFKGFFISKVFEPGSPEELDNSGAWTTAEEIERGCDRFALNGSRVGIYHTDIPEEQGANHPHFVLLRNWIQYGDYQIGSQMIKHGTWMQAYQAVSPWAIAAVENYELNALSAAGSARFFDE